MVDAYRGRAVKKEKHVIRKIRIKKAYEKVLKKAGLSSTQNSLPSAPSQPKEDYLLSPTEGHAPADDPHTAGHDRIRPTSSSSSPTLPGVDETGYQKEENGEKKGKTSSLPPGKGGQRNNPYAGVLKQQAKTKQKWEAQRLEKIKERERQEKERRVALEKRKEQTQKMRARDRRGQPKLGQQISVLLDRIKKT